MILKTAVVHEKHERHEINRYVVLIWLFTLGGGLQIGASFEYFRAFRVFRGRNDFSRIKSAARQANIRINPPELMLKVGFEQV